MDTLKDVVRTVYSALKKTEKYMAIQYDYIEEILPKDIFFITSQELEDMYPGLSPKDREYKIVKEKGAVFIMQIGKMLASGEPHDGRAPDYDDLLSGSGYRSGAFFHGYPCGCSCSEASAGGLWL